MSAQICPPSSYRPPCDRLRSAQNSSFRGPSGTMWKVEPEGASRYLSATLFNHLRRPFPNPCNGPEHAAPHHPRHPLRHPTAHPFGYPSARVLLLRLSRYYRRIVVHHILRGPAHPSINPREIGTGVTRSGGTRNRVQHHVATFHSAGTQQSRRCAS